MSRLFVSDLDGTLLDASGKISDRSLAELDRLLDAGLPFTVATARSAVTVRAVLRGARLRLPIIEFNGAFITDLPTGRHLRCESIEGAAVRSVIRTGGLHGLAPLVATFDGQADHTYALPPQNEGAAGYLRARREAGDPRIREVADLQPAFAEQVVCLTFIERREVLEPLCAELRRDSNSQLRVLLFAEQYVPPWYWLTVHAGRATKAHAIEVLARDLGVPLEEVTVFGDQVNDIPMFEECGHAVAVANAAPELLPHADEVIGPNTEDSVVHYLAARWDARRDA